MDTEDGLNFEHNPTCLKPPADSRCRGTQIQNFEKLSTTQAKKLAPASPIWWGHFVIGCQGGRDPHYPLDPPPEKEKRSDI